MLGFDEHGHEEYAPPPHAPPLLAARLIGFLCVGGVWCPTAYVAQLGSKIDHEHKDPFVLPALKSVNERIMQYQTSVATFFAKMSQSFELFLNLLLSPIAIPVRGVQV